MLSTNDFSNEYFNAHIPDGAYGSRDCSNGKCEMEKVSVTNCEVNHPSHYMQGTIECIDVIEQLDLGFHLGNALKYIWRARHKGATVKDLKKAVWYLERYIERLEKE